MTFLQRLCWYFLPGTVLAIALVIMLTCENDYILIIDSSEGVHFLLLYILDLEGIQSIKTHFNFFRY